MTINAPTCRTDRRDGIYAVLRKIGRKEYAE